MKKQAVIIGYSGHAYVVLDNILSNGYVIKGYCEVRAKGTNPYDIEFLGSEKEKQVLDMIKLEDIFLGIGENILRRNVTEFLLRKKCSLPNLIHRSSVVSPKALIGVANTIMPGVNINSLARLGNGVICNTSSIIEHECHIGDYVHIAPGAVLAGNVRVGNNTFIGANSVIRQGIIIGENVVVGAGSVVTKDIHSGLTVFGNPAQVYLIN